MVIIGPRHLCETPSPLSHPLRQTSVHAYLYISACAQYAQTKHDTNPHTQTRARARQKTPQPAMLWKFHHDSHHITRHAEPVITHFFCVGMCVCLCVCLRTAQQHSARNAECVMCARRPTDVVCVTIFARVSRSPHARIVHILFGL